MPIVPKPYRASLSRTQGRKSFSIIFRHPVRKDRNTGKPGLRVRAGLNTKDEDEAKKFVNQMNELLANSDYWTIAAETVARERFNERVVKIFYQEIIPEPTDFMDVREQVISIPSSKDSNYRVALFLGRTGVGKTTVLRQLIGTHPKNERFPATSKSRTTIADTEIIVANGNYHAVVTFMERDEVRDYLEDCISKAVLTAYQNKSDADVLRSLLQHVDQRMRFNYVLGNGPSVGNELDNNDEDEDAFDDESNSEESGLIPEPISKIDINKTNELLLRAVNRAHEIANNHGEKLKADLDATGEADQRVIEELFEEELDSLIKQDEKYHTIADEIMDEIETRFDVLTIGSLHKKRGWPTCWEFTSPNRNTFIAEILRFSSNYAPRFGTLLTPLVNGIRIKGPFFPSWNEGLNQPLVLIDCEGLGHTPDSSSSLSTNLLRRISAVDAVVLVDNATDPMGEASVAALRSLVQTGNVKKLLLCFTHFDDMKETDNLPTPSAKREHVLASVESVMTRLGEDLGPSATRALRTQIDKHHFFLGGIDKVLDTQKRRGSIRQIDELLTAIDNIVEQPEPVEARPVYDKMNLVLAILQAADQFQKTWLARLGRKYKSGINKEHWTRVKALNRQLALGWSDEYDNLKPVADLQDQLCKRIYVTTQKPIRWEGGEPNEDEQQLIFDEISASLSTPLLELASRRVRFERSDEWQRAWSKRGKGSTFVRAEIISTIYEKAAPVPDLTPSLDRNKFLHEVIALVEETCKEFKITLE